MLFDEAVNELIVGAALPMPWLKATKETKSRKVEIRFIRRNVQALAG